MVGYWIHLDYVLWLFFCENLSESMVACQYTPESALGWLFFCFCLISMNFTVQNWVYFLLVLMYTRAWKHNYCSSVMLVQVILFLAIWCDAFYQIIVELLNFCCFCWDSSFAVSYSEFFMQHNNEETHRGLKRKPPHMDRGQERRPYNTNSRPYDMNAVPDGGLLFLFIYLTIYFIYNTHGFGCQLWTSTLCKYCPAL